MSTLTPDMQLVDSAGKVIQVCFQSAITSELTGFTTSQQSEEQHCSGSELQCDADTPCKGNMLTRRPSSAGAASKGLGVREVTPTYSTGAQSVARRASESSLGTESQLKLVRPTRTSLQLPCVVLNS